MKKYNRISDEKLISNEGNNFKNVSDLEKFKNKLEDRVTKNLFFSILDKEYNNEAESSNNSKIDDYEMIKWLIKNEGLSKLLEKQTSGGTIFHYVASTNNYEMFKWLFENVYDSKSEALIEVKKTNNVRFTVLHSTISEIVDKFNIGITSINWDLTNFILENNFVEIETSDMFGRSAGNIIEDEAEDQLYEEYQLVLNDLGF